MRPSTCSLNYFSLQRGMDISVVGYIYFSPSFCAFNQYRWRLVSYLKKWQSREGIPGLPEGEYLNCLGRSCIKEFQVLT